MASSITVPDLTVVGSGIVGLATAVQLLRQSPGMNVLVVDKERRVGAHQSSHNSGVIHAGLYYQPGSLKAKLCSRGKILMERYADDRGIQRRAVGKVVVAPTTRDIPHLDAIEARARANRVPDLQRLTAQELHEIEPSVNGVAALHSPETGVIDYGAVCAALAEELLELGGELKLDTEVVAISEQAGQVLIFTRNGTMRSRRLVTCAGLQADRVAQMTQPSIDTRIVPFRGRFWEISGGVGHQVRGNIYPVPDPRFPFLGVHFTRDINDRVWMGPTAFLALNREGYGHLRPRWRDVVSILGFAGFWKFARRNVRPAVHEGGKELSARLLLREAKRLLPELSPTDLGETRDGIRAQAMSIEGALVDDFLLVETDRVTHVINAPSPAATASLAIAEYIVGRIR